MILERFRLDGQVALVTGGTKGIGKAVALAFAEAGADVAVVSRAPNPDLEKAIKDLGRSFMHIPADLTDRFQTRKVIPAVLEEMGDIDILFNNAGICPRAPAADFPEADWDAALEIHLSAAFTLAQSAGRIMLKKQRGKIISTASVLSFQGGINVVAYAAAKHAIAGLTKALANDWAGKGINVNAIAPGYIATDMTGPLMNDPQRSKLILGRTPAGRWGQPDDIKGAAVFLASSASDYVHGVVLHVDGGWMAW